MTKTLRVGLFVFFDQIVLGRIVTEATRLDAQHVDRRFAVDDPFGQLPPGATGCSDTETMPFAEPEIVPIPGRPDDRVAVGRVGDRHRCTPA